MKKLIFFLAVLFIAACKKETVEPNYTNHLIINDKVVSGLYGVKVWNDYKTINLMPKNGIIVLNQLSDTLANGYIIINGTHYHFDGIKSVMRYDEKRIAGDAFGEILKVTCPPTNEWYNVDIVYNLELK